MRQLGGFDHDLAALLDALAEQLRGVIRQASGSEIVRRKADGDVTRRFDTMVEDRLVQLLVESRLPVRVHSEEREAFDLVQSPELLAIIDPVGRIRYARAGVPALLDRFLPDRSREWCSGSVPY